MSETRPGRGVKARRDAWASLGLGLVLAIVSVATWFGIWTRDPRTATTMSVQTGLHLAFGREGAIPAGLAGGLTWMQSFLTAQALEWSMLFLGFPLIVLFGEALHHIRPIRRVLDAAEAFAHRRPNAGILALGGMTLVPWLPFGALTAVFIGEALRLPSRRLLPVIALAELLANLSFALATAFAVSRLPDPRLAAAAIAGVFILLSIGAALWPRRDKAPKASP